MKHYLYKLTDPEGKSYIGVTCNFKRRMKEHRRSTWPVGVAIRHFGEENFKVEIEEFESQILAYNREFELVNFNTIETLYNMTVGGSPKTQMLLNNPMLDAEVAKNHPGIWTSENNPMHNPVSKEKMISSQKRKRVSVDGVIYEGVREAARAVGESRQCLVHRLRSVNFPTCFYL